MPLKCESGNAFLCTKKQNYRKKAEKKINNSS